MLLIDILHWVTTPYTEEPQLESLDPPLQLTIVSVLEQLFW